MTTRETIQHALGERVTGSITEERTSVIADRRGGTNTIVRLYVGGPSPYRVVVEGWRRRADPACPTDVSAQPYERVAYEGADEAEARDAVAQAVADAEARLQRARDRRAARRS